MSDKYLKSPMNYIGGKYKLLDQIIPLFPKDINTFYDMFCGGCNVAINIRANKVICNDTLTYMIDLYKYFKKNENVIEDLKKIIHKYDLSKDNRNGYNLLRENYNLSKSSLELFALICYSFNHQIRFNSKHEFNTPFGQERSSFNEKIEKNLLNLIDVFKNNNFEFENKSFEEFSSFEENDFIYCDPPYLITTASYNDGKRGFHGWNENYELKLLNFLTECDEKNIRFALSNVIKMGDKENVLLKNWSNSFKVIELNCNYNNSNYQREKKDTREVLVVNY